MSETGKTKREADIIAGTMFCMIAVFGSALLLYVLGSVDGRQSETRQQAARSYSQAAKDNAERACLRSEPHAVVECVYVHIQAAEETARAEQDLSAQQKSADSALASAIIAFLTLIVSGIGVWFVKRTLEATRDAITDTSKATAAMIRQNELTEALQRPYIVVEAGKSPTEPNEAGFIMPASYRYVNVGGTPANLLWEAHSIVVLDDLNALPDPVRPGGRGRKIPNGETIMAGASTKFKSAGAILNSGKISPLAPEVNPRYKHAFEYDKATFFHGFVIYADFEGKAYVRGFCFTYGNRGFRLFHPSKKHNYDVPYDPNEHGDLF